MIRFFLLPWIGVLSIVHSNFVGRDDLGAPWQLRVQGSPLQAARPVVVPYKASANMCPVRFIRRLYLDQNFL